MNKTVKVTLIVRNDTRTEWEIKDPVLCKGEIGIEMDTSRFKIGDGVLSWSQLNYSSVVNAREEWEWNDYILASGELGFDKTSRLFKVGNGISQWQELEYVTGEASTRDVGVHPGAVPEIGPDGKLDRNIIPAVAITDVYVVETLEEVLHRPDIERGDVAIVLSESKTYILQDEQSGGRESWAELLSPTCYIESVNGKTGIVELDTNDIPEGGNNLYYTEERATNNFHDNFGTKRVEELADGDRVLFEDDYLILDCGNA